MPLPRPFIVGSDLAGVVKAVGPDATRFRVGDRVWGANQGVLGRQGTFAELAAIDERWLYPTPDRVTDEQAAAMALVGITAHLGLVDEAKLDAGETILVNGGSGAVGSTVIQMAKALGAQVIATTSGAEKVGVLPLARRRPRARPRRRQRRRARAGRSSPTAPTSGGRPRASPTSTRPSPAWRRRGRLVLMAGRTARPELPVGPFYTKCCRMLRLRHVPRGAGVAAPRRRANQPLAGVRRPQGEDRPRGDARRRARAAPPAGAEHASTRRASIRGKLVVKM